MTEISESNGDRYDQLLHQNKNHINPQEDHSVFIAQQQQRNAAHTVFPFGATNATLASPIVDPSILSLQMLSYQQQQQQEQQKQQLNYPFSISQPPPLAPSLSFASRHPYFQQPQQQQISAPVLGSFSGMGFSGYSNAYGVHHNEEERRQQIMEQSEPILLDETINDCNDPLFQAAPPAVERELEESFQENASFDELEHDDNSSEKKEEGLRNPIDVDDNEDLMILSEIEPIHSSNPVNDAANCTSGSIRVDIDDDDGSSTSDVIAPINAMSGSPSIKINRDGQDDFDVYKNNEVVTSLNKKLPMKKNTNIENISSNNNINNNNNNNNITNNTKEVKFRAYQAENWTEKFEDLLQFRDQHGHCLVPNCHPDNPGLAQWTKRQRYQYKLKKDGKRSTITEERIQVLNKAGFVWDSHKAVWAERFQELKEFRDMFGHCNVPSRYQTNHQLAIWVKRQRRQWKSKMDSQPHCMTDERQKALESIGFVWDMKNKNCKNPTH